MEQKLPLQQIVLEQLDTHVKNKEPDTGTIYASQKLTQNGSQI